MIRPLPLAGAILLVATGPGCMSAQSSAESGLAEYGFRADADAALSAVAEAAGFQGHIGISRREGSYHLLALRDPELPGNSDDWPWASVTKQVLATIVLQQVADGHIDLDAPASIYLAAIGDSPQSPTVRQLLQHRSGLPNPDADAPPSGFPAFYTNGNAGTTSCLTNRKAPPAVGWAYNNCDYIVLGALLEAVTGQSLQALFDSRIAQPAGMSGTSFLEMGSDRSFMSADATYRTVIPNYGASASLVGPLEDMVLFDRALLDGTLLPRELRDAAWRGDPALGYQALGQWVFEAPLSGCTAPVTIVERRGQIGRYQLRNFILPAQDLVLVLASEKPNFDFGEIWTGEGVSHDLLSRSACGEPS